MRGKFEDLTGKTFGRLKVIERAEDKIYKVGNREKVAVRWLCECQCENKTRKIVFGESLKKGLATSCGCIKKKRRTCKNKGKSKNAKDIPIGTKFGRLTVIKRDDSKVGKGAYWLCKCSCGNPNLISVLGVSLRNGSKQSCGCLKKEHDKEFIENGKKINTYDLSGDYGIGFDSKMNKFYFDLEDYNKIKNYYWYKNHQNYIVSVNTDLKNKENGHYVSMHRFILNLNNSNNVVDHINHKQWDNRKINLRICSSNNNAKNKSIQYNNTSGYPGVTWHKKSCSWIARINKNKKRISLGSFDTFEEAVKVRKEAEIKYYGEYRNKYLQ